LTPAAGLFGKFGRLRRVMPGKGRKFRFRAGLAAWQTRNALSISTTSPRANAENHGIVTVSDPRPVSEFLIVGCQHGWL